MPKHYGARKLKLRTRSNQIIELTRDWLEYFRFETDPKFEGPHRSGDVGSICSLQSLLLVVGISGVFAWCWILLMDKLIWST